MPDTNSGGQGGSQGTEDAATQGAQGGEGTGTQSQGDGNANGESGNQGDGGEGDGDGNGGDGEPEIPQRRSPVKDFIIDRKNTTIQKLRDGKGGEKDGDPEFAAAVAREVNKILRPTLDTLGAHTDAQELAAFLVKPENAHFKQYEKAAPRYMATYKNVPLEFIFKALDYDNAMKRGASAGAQAKDEANRNSMGGNTGRQQQGGGRDWSSASPQEVEAEHNRIMNR